MNIFLTVLIALFLGAYYALTAPSVRTQSFETEYAIKYADLRAIIECTAATHNANLNGAIFQDICVEQNGIQSDIVCLDKNMRLADCDRNTAYNYVITTSGTIPNAQFNNTMTILENNFADSGGFGVFKSGGIIAGNTVTKRNVPKALISHMHIQDGQLVYLTQFAKIAPAAQFTSAPLDDIVCPAGTSKIFRFGRWQCVGYNTKNVCAGDTIWDYSTQSCIPDDSLKPLCNSIQTALLIDDVWECVDPFPDKKCPDNATAKLNYTTMEWECVVDPNKTETNTKCSYVKNKVLQGRGKANLSRQHLTCTDCEKIVIDEDTCVSHCVPDPDKITSDQCYPDKTAICEGTSQGIYFGFPNMEYVRNVDAVSGKTVVLDSMHSQNRKFNCMDCGARGINTEKSFIPYIVVCN